MFNLKKVIAAATLSVAAMSAANAFEISLDNFEYEPDITIAVDGDTAGQPLLRFLTGDNTLTTPLLEATATAQTTNSLIAANVDFTLSLVSDNDDAGDAFSISTVSAGNGSLNFSEAAGIQAALEIAYSGDGGAVLDASPFNAFYFDLSPESGNEGFELSIQFTDTLGGLETLTVAGNELNAIGNRVTVSYDEIADLVDLTSLTSIVTTISSPDTFADLVLVDLGFIAVPEPTTLAIFGLALLGFGVRRRNA